MPKTFITLELAAYCPMHRSVTFDFHFALGLKHGQSSMEKCDVTRLYTKYKKQVKCNTSMHHVITTICVSYEVFIQVLQKTIKQHINNCIILKIMLKLPNSLGVIPM